MHEEYTGGSRSQSPPVGIVVDRSEDGDSYDSDAELDIVMTTALLGNGKRKLAAGDLAAAERVFHKCSARLPSTFADVCLDDPSDTRAMTLDHIFRTDSILDTPTDGTYHIGVPTRLSYAKAKLVGHDVQEPPARNVSLLNTIDQLPSSLEHHTRDVASQLITDCPETLPELDHVVGSACQVDGVSIPAPLTRRNSWTQADIDYEKLLGTDKRAPLESDNLSRSRASALQPQATDAWEEKKIAQRSWARRNGKRVSRASRARPLLPGLDASTAPIPKPRVAGVNPEVSTASAGVEHGLYGQHEAGSTWAAPKSMLYGRSAARMSIDEWQEKEFAKRLRAHTWEVDVSANVYPSYVIDSEPDFANATYAAPFAENEREPTGKHDSALLLGGDQQHGLMDHKMQSKADSELPSFKDMRPGEFSTMPDRNPDGVPRRTLTSASVVSYATTMSRARSADSSTTIKPNKRDNDLTPTVSAPSRPPKLVLIGDALCGKTAIARRFADGEYNESWGQIGAFNYNMSVETDRPGKTIEIDLWDTAGQEEFSPVRQLAYVKPQCILICFAVDSIDSFDDAMHAVSANSVSKIL